MAFPLLALAVTAGAALLLGSSTSTWARSAVSNPRPPRPMKVTIGPARLQPPKPKPKAKTKVNIGPARILPTRPGSKTSAAKPTSAKAPAKQPVVVNVPTTRQDTLVVAALSAKQASGQPLAADDEKARKGAQSVADHVRNKKDKYSRSTLAAWQVLAGIPPDGLYGPQTARMLRAFGAKNVTGQIFKGAKS